MKKLSDFVLERKGEPIDDQWLNDEKPVMTKDGRQAMINKLDNLKVLQERILSLHHQGYNNKEIQRTIYPKTYPITYFSLGEWDTMHVINSFVNESDH